MRREITVEQVHGYGFAGMVDATFDERLGDADAPLLRRREVLDSIEHASGRALEAWRQAGGVMPPKPVAPTVDEIDAAALNLALTQPGTVTRAMGEILFGVIKGTIAVTPSLTKAQFAAMLKAKMRNGA